MNKINLHMANKQKTKHLNVNLMPQKGYAS